MRHLTSFLLVAFSTLVPAVALADVYSAELYTTQNSHYGRYSARIQFAGGSGVISSFFLWKEPSYKPEVFWNELDFEKVGLNSSGACSLETNAITGLPGPINHITKPSPAGDLCGAFHTYTYEWTPTDLVWSVDGVEIRRETGDLATAFKDNAPDGMQVRFNIWPGNASFGGDFSPSILPVYEKIDWVSFESWDETKKAFVPGWKEEFEGSAVPTGWATGNWKSPKELSTHLPDNVIIKDGFATLALTSDAGAGGTPSTTGSSGGGTKPASGGASGSTTTPTGTGATSASGGGGASGSTTAPTGTGANPAAAGAAGSGAGSTTSTPGTTAAGGASATGTTGTGAKSGVTGATTGGSGTVPAATTTTPEDSGCSLSPQSQTQRSWTWLVGVAAVTGLGLSRRRVQRRSNVQR